jgi:hypothetical protein
MLSTYLEMEGLEVGTRIIELQHDLERKWRQHGIRLKEFWRSFDQVCPKIVNSVAASTPWRPS